MHRVVKAVEPDQVWKALQRPESWSRIGGVSKIEQPTFDARGEITGYRFNIEIGGKTHVGTATRSETTPGRRVAMTIDSDQMGGLIDVDLEPANHQTAVTVAMTVQSKSLMTAIVFPMIVGAIASGFNDAVERFAAELAAET